MDNRHGFNAGLWLYTNDSYSGNYAKCPDCGGLMEDDGMCYTSYPPCYKFICLQCGKVAWSYELSKR